MILFKRLEMEDVPWEKLEEYESINIFHTLPWIKFIQDTKDAEPVVAAVQSDGQVQGYFMGLITKKNGLRILGSPFRGWGTYFMGFILKPEISYHAVLQAFPKFAFNELKCHYLEITDTNFKKDEMKGLPYLVEQLDWFYLDLTKSEEELFANMKSKSGRRAVRRAIKKGVVMEETTDPGLADEYFTQHQEVLARKGLVPTYSLEFVRKMINHLLPTGNMLLLRARNSEGVCIATYIYLVLNKIAVGWGAASRQDFERLNPNELEIWYTMKKLKSMGVEVLHMGGEAEEFKRKLGSSQADIFRLMKPKNPILYIPLFIVSSLRSARIRNWVLKRIGV